MILEVLKMGSECLLAKAKPVETFDTPELQSLLVDMHDTMEHLNGAGLAAPQIGVSLRVVVFGVKNNPRYPHAEDIPYTVLINPVIQPLSDVMEEGWEGCLSVEGMRAAVERPNHVRIEALDRDGKPKAYELKGFPATVVQHECDHLDGVLYVDRAEAKTLMFLREYRRFGPHSDYARELGTNEPDDDDEDEPAADETVEMDTNGGA